MRVVGPSAFVVFRNVFAILVPPSLVSLYELTRATVNLPGISQNAVLLRTPAAPLRGLILEADPGPPGGMADDKKAGATLAGRKRVVGQEDARPDRLALVAGKDLC